MAAGTMPKFDLIFGKPLMNVAGTLGFAPDRHAPVVWDQLGAFITNPISMRRRGAAGHPTALEYPGGILLHAGLPNPGFESALQKYAHAWKDSPLPVIVHLMADRPEETRQMVRALEGFENVLAAELGFAPLLADDIILLAIEMSRGELPVIACLPHTQVLRLGSRVVQEGAAAISFAPPRGSLLHAGEAISGRLFGPSLFPEALALVAQSTKSGVPTIGAGGVSLPADAEAMLSAGALGVQLDTQLWLPKA